MTWDLIEGDWNRFKVAAKRRWDKLSEQQLHAIAGRRPLLQSRIREVYAVSMDEADRQVSDWQARVADGVSRA